MVDVLNKKRVTKSFSYFKDKDVNLLDDEQYTHVHTDVALASYPLFSPTKD